MSDAPDLSLATILTLCREREARLPYEIGAVVVLEACEAVLDQPRKVEASSVWVSPSGDTRITSAGSVTDAEAARSVAELLAAVLVLAGQEVPSMLLALVEASAAEALGLRGYRDELEAALVPLNRAAARRVLSRQLRDLQRPKREGQEQARLDPEGADADLDALLGYEAPPKPVPKPAATAGGAAGDEANEGPSSGSVAESEVPVSQEPQVPQAHEGQGAPEEARRSSGDRGLERSREPDLEGVLERSAPRRGATLLWVVLVVALLAAGAFFAAPQMFGG